MGCDEHQDEHKDLYWFGLSERNTLHPVWVSVCFIDLSELDRDAHNGRDYKLGSVVRSIYSSGHENFLVSERDSLCGLGFLL
jgi:hypothetical protein